MSKRTVLILAALFLLSMASLPIRSQAEPAAQGATPAATAQVTADCVPEFTLFNMNTGTAEEFLTIPDMNNRMVREYDEYRPYTSILQFRKEIGKYVGADQVAAWEKYIYVPVQVDSADVETLKQIPGVTDDIANALIAGQPYTTNEAFLAQLATLLTPDQVAFAANYLDVSNATPNATLTGSETPKPEVTAQATPCATATEAQ